MDIFIKGGVHIWGEICPRSDPDISHLGYYLDPKKFIYNIYHRSWNLESVKFSHVKYPLTNSQIWTPPYSMMINWLRPGRNNPEETIIIYDRVQIWKLSVLKLNSCLKMDLCSEIFGLLDVQVTFFYPFLHI